MKIHALAYLIIGILVTFVSSQIEGFEFFIIIGSIFIFVGVVKFILNGVRMPKSITPNNSLEDVHEVNGQKYVKCKKCRAYNYPSADFFHHCVKRVK